MGIAIAPSNPDVVYTVIEAESKKDKELYKSIDQGETWNQMNNDFGITVRPFYFSRIVVDKNENVIYKGGLNGSVSKDGGKTFKNLGNMHSDIHILPFQLFTQTLCILGQTVVFTVAGMAEPLVKLSKIFLFPNLSYQYRQ